MSTISIIGLGTMGRAIGGRAVAGGNAVEVIGRDPAKAADLARALGRGGCVGDGHPAREPARETLPPGRQPARVA